MDYVPVSADRNKMNKIFHSLEPISSYKNFRHFISSLWKEKKHTLTHWLCVKLKQNKCIVEIAKYV